MTNEKVVWVSHYRGYPLGFGEGRFSATGGSVALDMVYLNLVLLKPDN